MKNRAEPLARFPRPRNQPCLTRFCQFMAVIHYRGCQTHQKPGRRRLERVDALGELEN